MPQATLDHADVVCAVLVEAAAVAGGFALEVLSLLNCVIIGHNPHDTMWLVRATLELADDAGIVEHFLGDIGLILIKIDGLMALFEDFFDCEGVELFPVF